MEEFKEDRQWTPVQLKTNYMKSQLIQICSSTSFGKETKSLLVEVEYNLVLIYGLQLVHL
jgi:hypothetical protein